LAVALAGVLAVSSAAQQTKQTTKYRIVGGWVNGSDPAFVTLACAAKWEAKKLGSTVTIRGPATFDVGKELASWDAMAVMKPDGVISLPGSPAAFIAPTKAFMKKGIPVVTADGALNKPVEYVRVAVDFSNASQLFMERVGTIMQGTGTLGIIALDPAGPVDLPRYVGGVKLLKAKYPNIKVAPVQYAGGDQVKAASQVSAMIVANPDLSVVFASNGPQGAGAASAILAAHKRGEIKLITYDATPVAVQGLKTGAFDAVIAASDWQRGILSVREIVNYLKKHGVHDGAVAPKKNPHLDLLPLKVLTKANVDTPAALKFETGASVCKALGS
jgi:ribose transport system substrate-binding protein